MRCAHGSGSQAPSPYFTTFVEGRRGEILDAALAIFAEKGYEAGTMREIAAVVGVSEPALYRHYTGKEALLLDLVATAGDHIALGVRRRLDEVQPANLRASLANLLNLRRQNQEDGRHIMRVMMEAAPHHEAMRGTFREHLGNPMVGNIRSFIPRVDAFFGIERSSEELDARVRAWMSLINGYHLTAMFFNRPTDDDAIVDAMLAIMGWEQPA